MSELPEVGRAITIYAHPEGRSRSVGVDAISAVAELWFRVARGQAIVWLRAAAAWARCIQREVKRRRSGWHEQA
jgi:hypothetical protein